MADEQTIASEEQSIQAPEEPAGNAALSSPGTPESRAGRASFPIEEIIGWILRIGVTASAVLITAGVFLLFITRSTGYPGSLDDLPALLQYGPHRTNLFPTSPGDVLSGLAQFKPYALIALGLVLLIATPVIRVAASVVIFLLERDYAYVFITLLVLLILLVSFLLGKAG
jgi:uncharacterized membrane protein